MSNPATNSIQLTEQHISDLAEKKVFFGHQSVGFNILDGITDITSDLNIIESRVPPEASTFFAHSEVGENTKPETKLADFAEILRTGMGNSVDIAFLKFCYVDVLADTDPNAVFQQYKSQINILKGEFPDIQFVHMTVPLTRIETGLKAFAKKVLGRTLGGSEKNLRRQEYNELIRNEYAGKEPLFDIALIESTKPNGKRLSYKLNEQIFYTLVPRYTDDGGHLNEFGRKIIAEQLIIYLSELK